MEDRIPAPASPASPLTVALDVKAIKPAVALLCCVALRKHFKPAFRSILVEVRRGRLVWSATDLDRSASVELGDAVGAADGRVASIDAHAFKAAIGKAKGLVTITLGDDGARVASSAGSFVVPSLCPASDLPDRPPFNPQSWLAFTSAGLGRAIERTIGATDGEVNRYACSTILVEPLADDGSVLFVATDGRRLHVQRTEAFRSTSTFGDPEQRAEPDTKDGNLLLPLGIACLIPAALKLQIDDAEPQIASDATHVYVNAGPVLLTSRLADGRFPHWRDVVADHRDADRWAEVRVNALAAVEAFKACTASRADDGPRGASVLAYVRDPEHPAAPEGLVVEQPTNAGIAYRLAFTTSVEGTTSHMDVNAEFMADAIAPLVDRKHPQSVLIRFEASGEGKIPALIRSDDGFEAWVMPLGHDGDKAAKIKAEDKARAVVIGRHLADAGYTIAPEPIADPADDDEQDPSRDVEATDSDPVPTADATPAEPVAEAPPAAETAHEAPDVASSPEHVADGAENRATATESERVDDASADDDLASPAPTLREQADAHRAARRESRESRLETVRERMARAAERVICDWLDERARYRKRNRKPSHPGYRTADEQRERDRLAVGLKMSRRRLQAWDPWYAGRYAAARARIAAREAAQGRLALDGAFDASEAWARDVEATGSHPALTAAAVPPAVDVVASTAAPEPLSVPPARVDVVASILATANALVILFGPDATAAAVLICSEPIDSRRVLRCSTADVPTVDPLGLAASGLLDELADRVSARRSERRTAAALRAAARSALVGATTDAGTAVATALAEAWEDDGPDNDGPEPGDDGDSTRDVEATDSHPEPATSWPRASIEDRIKATQAELEAAQAELARLRDAAAVVCTKHTQYRIYSLMRRVEYLERRASRADRLRERAERARARAQAHYQASNDAVAGIEFGQPILVGHHSERRHRRDLARSASHMDKMVEATREAERLDSRADAAEGNEAIRSDDPGAIDAYRAKIEALRERHAVAKRVNADLRKAYGKHEGRWKRIDGPDRDRLHACVYSIGAPMWAVKELDSYMHAFPWFPSLSLDSYTREIKRCEERIKALEAASVAADLEWTGEGCTVRLSHERGRAELQVQHDRKPPAEVREQLKSLGFRWVRSLGFWSASDRFDRRAFAVGLTGGAVAEPKFQGDDEPTPDVD